MISLIGSLLLIIAIVARTADAAPPVVPGGPMCTTADNATTALNKLWGSRGSGYQIATTLFTETGTLFPSGYGPFQGFAIGGALDALSTVHPQATFQTQAVFPISMFSYASIGNYTFSGDKPEVGHFFTVDTRTATTPYQHSSVYTMVSPQLQAPQEEPNACYTRQPVKPATAAFTEAQFVALVTKVSGAFATMPLDYLATFFGEYAFAVLKHHTFWHGDVVKIFESLKAQGGNSLIVNVNKAHVGATGSDFSAFDCHFAVRKQAIIGDIVSEGHAMFIVNPSGLIEGMMINKQCDDK